MVRVEKAGKVAREEGYGVQHSEETPVRVPVIFLC